MHWANEKNRKEQDSKGVWKSSITSIDSETDLKLSDLFPEKSQFHPRWDPPKFNKIKNEFVTPATREAKAGEWQVQGQPRC